MITEDYVSFETAKLLKEKGFNEKCDNIYFGDDGSGPSYIRDSWENGGDVCPMSNSDLDDGSKYADISAPTLQMAMKWLREVHNLFIFPFPQMNTNKFWTEIYQLSDNQEWENIYCESIDLQDYPTYEEAAEAAIRYCLENIIK